MLHTLTEKKIIIKHHLVSKEEWDQKISRFNSMLLENSPRNLISKYSRKIKLNDKIAKINQCPFKK
jgi:predicted metallo-beta-lactamase superfamily hydrolase